MSKKLAISIQDISLSYDDHHVIKELSLDIQEGEAFGLIGLNGSGKTTLIKSILGLRDTNKGDIKIFDKPRSDKLCKRHLAYLPERFEPPYFLCGLEFVKFSLDIYGKKFNQDAVEKASMELALDPKVLKNRVNTYSKGMRQKLGLLSTLLTECPLLILDEPMSGLDPQARVYVKKTLINAKKEGRTVFLCSHILSDMSEICDRVGILSNGALQYIGRPSDLCKKHKTTSLEKAFLMVIENDVQTMVA